MEYETGQLNLRVVFPEWIQENSSTMSKYYGERFKRSLLDSVRDGVAYFVWVGEAKWFEHNDGEEFYEEMPYRFYDDSEVLIKINALLLLIDWSLCEVGEATIGRPEWIGVSITVPGSGGESWHFRREYNSTKANYAKIWRRVA